MDMSRPNNLDLFEALEQRLATTGRRIFKRASLDADTLMPDCDTNTSYTTGKDKLFILPYRPKCYRSLMWRYFRDRLNLRKSEMAPVSRGYVDSAVGFLPEKDIACLGGLRGMKRKRVEEDETDGLKRTRVDQDEMEVDVSGDGNTKMSC